MSLEMKTKKKTAVEIKKPSTYVVVMFNDDITTMEFVVQVLKTVFNKTEQEATSIMLEVHNYGMAVLGLYTYDIATTKKIIVDQMSHEKGFPLKLTIDEAR